MSECSRCGRPMRIEGALCKFCMLEEAELGAARMKVSPVSTGPSNTVSLVSLPLNCPYCNAIIPEDKEEHCEKCGLVFERCGCGGISAFFPDFIPHPIMDLQIELPYFVCAHCNRHIDKCPKCQREVLRPPATCAICGEISLWGYEGQLDASGMIPVLEEIIAMIEKANTIEDALKVLNVHSRLSRILESEHRHSYKPINVCTAALRQTCKEIIELRDWFENVYERKVTRDPSMSNVLSNAQAATNMNAAFGRAISLVNELVRLAEVSYTQLSFHVAQYAVYCAVRAFSELNTLVSASTGESIVRLSGTNKAKYNDLLERTVIIIEQYSPKTADEIRVNLS